MITFLKRILDRLENPRRHTIKENIISALIGIAIGLPISIYAVNHRSPAADLRPDPEIYPVVIIGEDNVGINTHEVGTTSESVEMFIHTQNVDEWHFHNLTPEEYDVLARCVEAEAGNQDLLGRQLVVDVVFNRVDSPDFPDNVIDVIYQEHQFAVVTDGRIDKVTPSEDTYKAIDLESDYQTNTKVLWFSAEGFLPYGEPWEKVGDHYFCNGKEEQ